MVRVKIEPFTVTVEESEEGDWLCTACIDERQLFRDIPYNHLAMAVFLLEQQMDLLELEADE